MKETNSSTKHDPNRQEADQLAVYKHEQGVERG